MSNYLTLLFQRCGGRTSTKLLGALDGRPPRLQWLSWVGFWFVIFRARYSARHAFASCHSAKALMADDVAGVLKYASKLLQVAAEHSRLLGGVRRTLINSLCLSRVTITHRNKRA